MARLAEVSLATVDRVLNERGSVAADTARRVIEIARQVGLRRTLPTPYARTLRLDVLLVRSGTPFFMRLMQAFVQIAGTLDGSVIIQRSTLDEAKPRLVAQRIRERRRTASSSIAGSTARTGRRSPPSSKPAYRRCA